MPSGIKIDMSALESAFKEEYKVKKINFDQTGKLLKDPESGPSIPEIIKEYKNRMITAYKQELEDPQAGMLLSFVVNGVIDASIAIGLANALHALNKTMDQTREVVAYDCAVGIERASKYTTQGPMHPAQQQQPDAKDVADKNANGMLEYYSLPTVSLTSDRLANTLVAYHNDCFKVVKPQSAAEQKESLMLRFSQVANFSGINHFLQNAKDFDAERLPVKCETYFDSEKNTKVDNYLVDDVKPNTRNRRSSFSLNFTS